MRKLTADFIYPISSSPIPNGVLVVDDSGKILEVAKPGKYPKEELEYFTGSLVPGFVNTHCHLELSHMKGKVDTGTGLIPFISNVVQFRESPQEEVQDAISRADQEMYDGGIVAVGDISNKTDTFSTKKSSKIKYYTFVEMFDFLQDDNAATEFDKYKEVYDLLIEDPSNKKACVPHAPYSVSSSLFRLITGTYGNAPQTVSIHNQETPPENELFIHGTGGFVDFYKGFGVSLDNFTADGRTSIYYAMENLDPKNRTLFVHNTLTTRSEIQDTNSWSSNVYWATCANANLYIENRLPDYRAFLETSARMTIGTDSLTSNWQLSVLEELKTISRFQSYVPFETLLKWATLNGAEALGYDSSLGSFETGKTPGVIHLNIGSEKEFTESTKVKRVC